MLVIILSWEYPPRIVGLLSDYVKELSSKLAKMGVKTYAVTYHDFITGEVKEDEVIVYRVTNPVKTHISVLTWTLTLNQEIARAAATIWYRENRQVDVVDVQDWHFVPAAVTLKNALHIPFVYTVESLEDHRSYGANSPLNMAIKSVEQLGMNEAEKVIAKSVWMAQEIKRIYNVPMRKIKVVTPKDETWIEAILRIYRSVIRKRISSGS